MASSPIPSSGAPFNRAEYQRRQDQVLAQLAPHGVDAIAVTAHSHQEYLSGYDGSGDYFGPFPLILAPGHPMAYVVRRYDEDAVRAASVIDHIVPYTHLRDAAKVWASTLRDMGLANATLGLELDAWNLAPADVARLQTELPGLRVVDVSGLVARVAAVKSPAEIATMREAMRLTELAVECFYGGLTEGVSEAALRQSMDAAVEAAGGSLIVSALLVGRRTALPHGQPSRHELSPGSPAFTEVGAEVRGYVAGLCRTGVLGRDTAAEDLYGVARSALDRGLDAMRPGATAGEVDAAVRSVVEKAGRADTFRHRAGYQIGLMWNDRGNISLEPGSTDLLRPGMTFHLPVILFEREQFGVGVSETVLITDSGNESLGTTSRELRHVE